MLNKEPVRTNTTPMTKFTVIASFRTSRAIIGAKIGLIKNVMEAADGPNSSIAFK